MRSGDGRVEVIGHGGLLGAFSLAMQFNAATLWHFISSSQIVPRVTIASVTTFIPRERPNVKVKHSIAGYFRLPLPTTVPALLRYMYWLRC